MRILIDTNILIYREDSNTLSDDIQHLFKIIEKNNIPIVVHPLSYKDISNDNNVERKRITLSKYSTYLELDSPPDPDSDVNFRKVIQKTTNENDNIDDHLIFSIYKDAVDLFISNDNKIHDKAARLQISDRILKIDEALEYFQKLYPEVNLITASPALTETPLHNINLDDDFFDSLKSDYPEFIDWFKRKSKDGAKAWVYYNKDKIGAFLLLKDEDEPIIYHGGNISKKKRIKISTFKVTFSGYKIGELFIKMSIEYAIKKNVDEIYLTHFTTPNDPLVILIEEFGFIQVAKKEKGEDIYIKKLKTNTASLDPIDISKIFYPTYYDGDKVNKFIIPIRAIYHDRLFQTHDENAPLLFYDYLLLTEANTIKKAYICHSKTKRIKTGDIIIFYMSGSKKGLTSVGIVENIYTDVQDANEILKYVGKRSVYSDKEITEISKNKTLIIIFRWHCYFRALILLKDLLNNNILRGAPQSIVEIEHEKYMIIKKIGKLDNGFTIH